MRRRWNALYQVALFVLVCVNLELFCYHRLLVENLESAQPLIVRNPHSGYRVRPHLTNFPGSMNDAVTTNSDGLRDTEVGPPEASELRILCVGGSQTFGWGLPFGMSWPRRLEAALQQRVPGVKVRVINAGQPGYNTGDAAGLVEELGERYQPQIVIAMFGFNDYTASTAFTPSRIRSATVVKTSRLLQWSATYRYLCWKLLKPQQADPSKLPPQLTGGPPWMVLAMQNLLSLKQVCEVLDARLMFCAEAVRPDAREMPNVTAAPSQQEYAALEKAYVEFGTWSQVPLLIMGDVFRSSGMPTRQFFQDASPVHTGEVGHEMEATRIADELIRLGWITSDR